MRQRSLPQQRTGVPPADSPLAIGIDLGGTKVAAALVDSRGEIISRGHRPTEPMRGLDAVVANLCAVVDQALSRGPHGARRRVVGAGVGAPGLVDADKGMVLFAPNLSWRDVPLAQMLAERLQLPTVLDNDANAAAVGEHWIGAAAGRRHVLVVTLGTGVGCGLILNGRIYRGVDGFAGELGHLPLLPEGPICGCGQRGCLETLASTAAVLQQAREAAAAGRAPLLAETARNRKGQVDIQGLLQAARQGDPVSRSLLEETGRYLGYGLAGVVNLLNPELVVIGGGISRGGELLLAPVREAVKRRALPPAARHVEVVAARLGNTAGVVGAARLVLDRAGLNLSGDGGN